MRLYLYRLLSLIFVLLLTGALFAGRSFSQDSSGRSMLLSASGQYSAVVVEKVVSADMIIVGGKRVVLIGIEAPRAPHPRYENRDAHGFIIHNDDPTATVEEQAWQFARDIMEGKTVRLEFDTEHRNAEGHLLAYVYLSDGKMANTEILRAGYARLHLVSPNVKYVEQFRSAYQEARREMRGLQGGW